MKLRKMTAQDVAAVFELIVELAIYEKAPQEVSNTTQKMLEQGFGENPAFWGFVVEDNAKIVGMAIYYIRYSTWKGSCIYLEDIVVTESYRGKGVGKLLFEAVMQTVVEKNAALLTWQVLDWNTPAINFYQKYQATLDEEWINGKLTQEKIKALLQ
jgi:GNAT superfamily N-acetyltransferase